MLREEWKFQNDYSGFYSQGTINLYSGVIEKETFAKGFILKTISLDTLQQISNEIYVVACIGTASGG